MQVENQKPIFLPSNYFQNKRQRSGWLGGLTISGTPV
jgi:hypothetical protein